MYSNRISEPNFFLPEYENGTRCTGATFSLGAPVALKINPSDWYIKRSFSRFVHISRYPADIPAGRAVPAIPQPCNLQPRLDVVWTPLMNLHETHTYRATPAETYFLQICHLFYS